MELGDQHVLTLGGDLHDAVRLSRADPDVLQQAQGIVLVGDQAPHRLERRLVLQGAVQDGPPQLVPAVGADVALGIELGEQELIRAALDPQPQRRRASRRLEADRLDLGHREPELVAHGLADRLPPPAGHIDVRGAAAPVGDGEHLVRGEETERGDRDRHRERHAEQHIARVIEAQVQPGESEHGDHRGHRRLGPGAGAARHGQAVDGAHQEDRHDRHRGGHPGVPGPAADDRHAVRARPGQPEIERLPEKLQEQHAAQEHQQVPPAPECHRQDDQRQAERGGPPAGAGHVDPAGHIGQPRRSYPGQLAQHPGAGPIVDPEPRRVLRGQERAGEDYGYQDQPRRRGDGDRVRQRRRRAGRAALTAARVGGWARWHCGPAIPGDRAADVLAQCATPLSGISSCARSQALATE